MNKETIPEGLFDPASRSHEKIAPNVSTASDPQSEQEDRSRIEKEPARGRFSQGELIDGIFNDPRDEKLEQINDEQGKKPNENLPPVIEKILFQGFKRSHSLRKPFSLPWKIKASSKGNGKDARIVIRLSLWS
jgi:hypothetical protein